MKNQAVIGIVYKNNQQEVLLVKRRDVPVWVLPGGGVDSNENSLQAVTREVKEETGLIVSVKRTIGEYSPLNRLAKFTEVFECEFIEGEIQTGAETKEINYFPIDKLPESLFPLHRHWLMEGLQNYSHVIQAPISQVTYFKLAKFFMQHPLWVLRFALSRLGFPINA